jgi:hypothetical protein
MARCQRYDVIEEEQGSPRPRLIERVRPIAELGNARDPQRPLVMADESTGVIDQTATVAGEQPSRRVRLEVAPWVNPILAGHTLS